MPAPSEGMKTLLIADGVGSGSPTVDWGIHVSKMPASPDRVIAIFDTGGFNPHPAFLLDFPTIQIRVRAKPGDYVTLHNKAQAIKDSLLGLPSQDLLGERWDAINLLSDIAFLGRDENDRPEFSLNFRATIEPAAIAAATNWDDDLPWDDDLGWNDGFTQYREPL